MAFWELNLSTIYLIFPFAYTHVTYHPKTAIMAEMQCSFTHLLSEMYIHGESNGILICGNLNSRIGHMKDTIDDIDQIPQ